MARVQQVARKSTAGLAPRRQAVDQPESTCSRPYDTRETSQPVPKHKQRRSKSDGKDENRVVVKPKDDTSPLPPTQMKHDVRPPYSSPRQMRLFRRYNYTKAGSQGFSFSEAWELYKAVPTIVNTRPEKLQHCWEELAAEKGHTSAEWQKYFEDHIKVIYMQRNKLSTEEELEAHVSHVIDDEYESDIDCVA